jgi:hypothetical protein
MRDFPSLLFRILQRRSSREPYSIMPPADHLTCNNLCRPDSAIDWDEHRTIIEQLYSTERKPLREVMEIMKLDYGLLATYFSSLLSPYSADRSTVEKIGLTLSQRASVQIENKQVAFGKECPRCGYEIHCSEAIETQSWRQRFSLPSQTLSCWVGEDSTLHETKKFVRKCSSVTTKPRCR